MHISLVNKHLVRWVGSLGLVILLSSRGLTQTSLQDWIDTVSGWAESYTELARLADQNANGKFESDLVLEELDRQREESRIDCLANRLLAEEYLPYDFDIRETMWCKGTLTLPVSTLCPAEIASAEDVACNAIDLPGSESERDPRPAEFVELIDAEWMARARSQVWSGFEAQLRSHWELALSYSQFVADTLQGAVAAIERQRIVNAIAQSPSLRGIFGRSVMPNEVGLTSQEYSKIAIQLWKELQAHAERNGILSRSPWFELKTRNLQPLYDLATVIPAMFGKHHR